MICASVALSEENCLFGKIWEDRQEEHNFLCNLQAPGPILVVQT
uniref:Uncharacterized protein n=1 Tax=Setaria italica TaxID=4555 RepID=K3ZGU8_SETIT